MKQKKKRKYWYFITRYECPVCGRSEECRERRYTKKPKKPEDRCKFVMEYDYCDVF